MILLTMYNVVIANFISVKKTYLFGYIKWELFASKITMIIYCEIEL